MIRKGCPMPNTGIPDKVKGDPETSYTSPGSTFERYFQGTVEPPRPAERQAETPTPVPDRVPGEDQTSYTNPGKSIPDSPIGSSVAGATTTAIADGIGFVNAAVLLSDHLGFLSFEEAAVALLAAKAGAKDFDLGALHGIGSTGKMAEALGRILPEIREAAGASLEARLRRVAAAIRESRRSFGGDDVTAVPVATLDHHVVVANTGGGVFRAVYEDDGRRARIIKVESMAAPAKPKAGVVRQITDAVTALLEGKKEKAKVHLKDLLAQSAGDGALEFTKARHQNLLACLKSESFWRNHVRTNASRIRTFVRGDLDEVYRSGVKARFQKAQEESDEKAAGAYREPVRKALQYVLAKVTQMREDVEGAHNRDRWLVGSLHIYDRQRGMEMAQFLNRFIGDLVETLDTLEVGIRATLSEGDLRFQASFHDALAEAYPDIALGYLFARKALGEIKAGVTD